MAKRITKTYSRFKLTSHFYLNRVKADNGDNNNDNKVMIGNPQLEMTHRIK
jgi:hypothetical protein